MVWEWQTSQGRVEPVRPTPGLVSAAWPSVPRWSSSPQSGLPSRASLKVIGRLLVPLLPQRLASGVSMVPRIHLTLGPPFAWQVRQSKLPYLEPSSEVPQLPPHLVEPVVTLLWVIGETRKAMVLAKSEGVPWGPKSEEACRVVSFSFHSAALLLAVTASSKTAVSRPLRRMLPLVLPPLKLMPASLWAGLNTEGSKSVRLLSLVMARVKVCGEQLKLSSLRIVTL